ncbi:MAG: TonB-dependent receptor [Rudanella sp.]|nr:TonB-dependent receptor [Rudanella sp.]
MRLFSPLSCLLLSVLYFTRIGLSLAQTSALAGQVRDRQTDQPVEYATVSVWSRDSVLLTGTVTDAKGDYTLPALASDAAVLNVQFMGYKTATIRLEGNTGTPAGRLPVTYLSLLERGLKEVTVKGERGTSTLRLDRQVLAAKAFQNAANGTGLDLLRRMPNVTVTNEGVIALRGNTGFLVLINGKPSTRAPADVLAQLPANLIESVEIITSPSAQYDAEGRAGIINIVTKTTVGQGWSVVGNTLFAGADPLRYGADLTLTYSAKRWNVYAGGDYRRYDIDGFRTGEVRTLVGDTLTYLPSEGVRNYKDYQYAGRVGGSFSPNQRTVITAGVYAGYKQTDRTANLHYDEFVQTGPSLNLFDNAGRTPRREFFNQNLFVRSGSFQAYNLDLTQTFANKSKLTVLGLYEYSVLGGPLTNRDTREGSTDLSLSERSDERSPLTGWRLQTDYSLPLPNKRRLDAGLQYRSLHHAGDFTFERLNLTTNQFETDPAFADRMDLTQRVGAGYVQLAGDTKRLAYNAGLRAEFTDRELTHRLGRQPFTYTKLSLFPSAQVLWTVSDAHKFRLAFSRRIDRPTSKLMAPFQNHRHAETIETGDPNLRPELANVVELSFSRTASKATLTLTGYYNHVTDKIFRVNTIYNRTILGRTYTNAGQATSVGTEGIAEVRLLPGWKAYLSGNIYQFRIRGVADGVNLNTNSLNYNLTGNTSLDFTKYLRFQWDLTYVSRTVTVQGVDSNLLLSNMGLKYNFPNGRGALNLQLINVFNSNIQTIGTQAPLFFSSTDYRKYDRVLQVGLSFSLNDSGKKAKAVKTEYGEKDF